MRKNASQRVLQPIIPARTRSSWYTADEEKPYLHRHEEASVYKSLAVLLVIACWSVDGDVIGRGGAAAAAACRFAARRPEFPQRPRPTPVVRFLLRYCTRSGEPDEAFQLYNPLETPVDLEAWQVSDRSRTVRFPAGINLDARTKLWCAKEGCQLHRDVRLQAGLRIWRRHRSAGARSDRRRAAVRQHRRPVNAAASPSHLL